MGRRTTLVLAGIFALAAHPLQAAECRASAEYAGPERRAPFDIAVLPAARSIETAPVSEGLGDRLGKRFGEILDRTNTPAATIAVFKPGTGYWSHSSGTGADDPRFWWASTGKLATATIILQLVDEGQLRLDDPVAEYFPGFAQAGHATIDDLLKHTSGIFSFNADVTHRQQGGYHAPDALLAVAARHPLDFCPGTNWNYSNTGYVMLARIAEQVEQKPFARIVRQRIGDRVGLEGFALLEPGGAVAFERSPGNDAPSEDELASVFGAGGIIATAGDMLAFLQAYVEGGLVPIDARNAAVTDLYPMFGGPTSYGRGIMVYDVADPAAPAVWIGHSGGTPHSRGLVIYDTTRDAYLAIALHGEAPVEAIANALLKELDRTD